MAKKAKLAKFEGSIELRGKSERKSLSFQAIAARDWKIPSFQREWSWDASRLADLADSVMRGVPLPTIFIWKTDTGEFVIDGGQRYRALKWIFGAVDPECDLDTVGESPAFFDVKTRAFETKPGRGRFNVREVMRHDFDRGGAFPGASDEEHAELAAMRSSMASADPPCDIVVLDVDKTAAQKIFIRLNLGSKKLQPADIRFGEFGLVGNENLAKRIREVIKENIEKGFAGINANHVLQAADRISTVMHGTDTSTALTPAQQTAVADKLEAGFRSARALIADCFDGATGDQLRTGAMMAVLATALGLNPTASKSKRGELAAWTLAAASKRRYASSVNSVLKKDLACVGKGNDYTVNLVRALNDSRHDSNYPWVYADDFRGTRGDHGQEFGLWAATVVAHQAKDFKSRTQVSKVAAVDRHHIFPRATLRNTKQEGLTEQIANITFIGKATNIKIKDTPAENYLGELAEQDRAHHCIPDECWDRESFEQFLDLRRELIAASLNELIRGLVAGDY